MFKEITPLAVGCVLLLTQVILFIIVLVHQIKKEQAEKTSPTDFGK